MFYIYREKERESVKVFVYLCLFVVFGTNAVLCARSLGFVVGFLI